MSDSEHLDFRLLKYIVAVAEAGTFTAAAARLHLSQSALSTQIRTLEDNLGVKIFDREHGTALTPEGKVLLRYGREGLRTREHIVQTIQAIHAGRMTPLRLAFTPFVLNPVLKLVSNLYRDLIPDSDIFPESGETDEVIIRLRDGEYDAALVTLPIDSAGLDIKILERERLLVCMRQDDPLSSYESVPVAELNGKVCMFRSQKHHPRAYQCLVDALAEFGVKPRPCKPMLNRDHIQWIVKESDCYALVREGNPLASGLVVRPMSELEWTVDTAIVYRSDHDNPALTLWIEELTKNQSALATTQSEKFTLSIDGQGLSKQIRAKSHLNQMALFSAKSNC